MKVMQFLYLNKPRTLCSLKCQFSPCPFIDNKIFAVQIRAHAVQLKPLLMTTVSRLFLSTFQQLSQRYKKSSLSRPVFFLRGLPAIFFNSKTKFSQRTCFTYQLFVSENSLFLTTSCPQLTYKSLALNTTQFWL